MTVEAWTRRWAKRVIIAETKHNKGGVKRATEAKRRQVEAKSVAGRAVEHREKRGQRWEKVEEKERVDGRWVTMRIGHQDS